MQFTSEVIGIFRMEIDEYAFDVCVLTADATVYYMEIE